MRTRPARGITPTAPPRAGLVVGNRSPPKKSAASTPPVGAGTPQATAGCLTLVCHGCRAPASPRAGAQLGERIVGETRAPALVRHPIRAGNRRTVVCVGRLPCRAAGFGLQGLGRLDLCRILARLAARQRSQHDVQVARRVWAPRPPARKRPVPAKRSMTPCQIPDGPSRGPGIAS